MRVRILSPAERRALRAKAHHLHPVVIVGHHGLTPAVLHEIDVNLLAHELVKIRVFSDDRSERETLLARISDELDAAPVQHLGKVLTIWRPSPEPEAAAPKRRATPAPHAGKPARTKPRGEARRVRTDLERPRVGTSKTKTVPPGPESRRRKPGPRDAARAKFAGDPGGRRRKPHARSGTAAPLAAEPGARSRKLSGRSGATVPYASDPGARRRKSSPRSDGASPFQAEPGTRRRRTKR